MKEGDALNAVDFTYDGQRLSTLGFIICEFDGDGGIEMESAGAEITFNTVSRHKGKKYSLLSTQYDSCITATFQICKDPCQYEGSGMYITSEEYRTISRWLNRGEFCTLRFYYDDNDNTRPVCYYNAGFNLSRIMLGGRLVGLELTMETDSPFGFGASNVVSQNISTAGGSITVTDSSDNIGYIYPDVRITCSSSGTYTLTNSLTGTVTTITGCASGEVINMYGDTMRITTSRAAHDIASCFNFQFLKLGNTSASRSNVITMSNTGTLRVSYAPVIRCYA